jgi:dTDP-4-dehydrorhamnose reductase
MKVLIVGSTGMLGSDCRDVFSEGHEVITPDKKKMNIVSWDSVIENLQEVEPEVIINCAGFTDVDACEKEDLTLRKINVEGPRNLAQCSARFECKVVHISSDYVFDGQKIMPQPYFEDDTPNPLGAYGRAKMESEKAIRENAPYYVIIRTGWLYGINGKNFVKDVIRMAVQKKRMRFAADQYGSPTWTHRLALQIEEILLHEGRGTYHATAEGYCNRVEYATFIVKKLGLKAKVEPCRLSDLRFAAKRPLNCVLENRLLKKQAINVMNDWKEDLEAFLDEFGSQLVKEAKTKKS